MCKENIQPSALEQKWKEFRASIKTEIPSVNFNWEDAIHYDRKRLQEFSPVQPSQDANT